MTLSPNQIEACEGWFSLFEKLLRDERPELDKNIFEALTTMAMLDVAQPAPPLPTDVVEAPEFQFMVKIKDAISVAITDQALLALLLAVVKPIDPYIYLLYIKYRMHQLKLSQFNTNSLCMAFPSGFLQAHEISILWKHLQEIKIDVLKQYIDTHLT